MSQLKPAIVENMTAQLVTTYGILFLGIISAT